ncbi:MAG: hypothetical protein WCK49_05690 [Myxococcaceae bacterium]
MRLSFDTNHSFQTPSVSEDLPKSEDRFENAGYFEQACNFLSKAISGVNHFILYNKAKLALGRDLPEAYRKMLYELNPEELVVLSQFFDELSCTQTHVDAAVVMTKTCSEFMEVSNRATAEILDLIRNFCFNKHLFNTQFATDSLGTLLDFQDSRIDRYYDNTIAFQNLIYKNNKKPDEQKFSDDIEKVKSAGVQWTLACTPGLGYMSHSGWEQTSCPSAGRPSLFYATRTLGLTRNGKACFARVLLDFSQLGPITFEKATGLLEAIDKNASKEKPEEDLIPGIEPIARNIIIKFSKDLAAACFEIHAKLSDDS